MGLAVGFNGKVLVTGQCHDKLFGRTVRDIIAKLYEQMRPYVTNCLNSRERDSLWTEKTDQGTRL